MAVTHRFSWLPYTTDEGPSKAVLVVVCDCGWADLTGNHLGTGWDAATLYVEHVKAANSDTSTPKSTPSHTYDVTRPLGSRSS